MFRKVLLALPLALLPTAGLSETKKPPTEETHLPTSAPGQLVFFVHGSMECALFVAEKSRFTSGASSMSCVGRGGEEEFRVLRVVETRDSLK
jgi:hypothetical protein